MRNSKTHTKFKDKQRKEGLWETVAASRNLSVNTVNKWFEIQRTRYGKLQPRTPKDRHGNRTVSVFFHIRRECLSLPCSSHHCNLQQPQLQFQILHERLNWRWKSASDVTHQLSTTSPLHTPPAVATTTAEDPVLDQFQQMRSMIPFFWVHVRTPLLVQNSRSAIISTLRLKT